MSTRRNRQRAVPPLPPLLVRLIHAARQAPDDPFERTGHADALVDLWEWASVMVPVRGVLAPADPEDMKTIQDIAMRHLELRKARKALRKALAAVPSFEERDEIDSARTWVQSVSDDVYYYAGLVCGVTLASLAERS